MFSCYYYCLGLSGKAYPESDVTVEGGLLAKEEVCGPPVYLTTGWQLAYEPVRKLKALQPPMVIPGHSTYMEGEALAQAQHKLVQNIAKVTVPDYGKFVRNKNT